MYVNTELNVQIQERHQVVGGGWVSSVVPSSAVTMIFSAMVSLHVLHLRVEVRWLNFSALQL